MEYREPDLPASPQCERDVIGAVLDSNTVYGLCADLTPDHFNTPIHRHVWEAIEDILSDGQEDANTISVNSTLQKWGITGRDAPYSIGDVTAILNNGGYALTESEIQSAIRALKEVAQRREDIKAAGDLAALAYSGKPTDLQTYRTKLTERWQQEPTVGTRRYRILSDDDEGADTSRRSLVGNIIKAGDIGSIYGGTGIYKTYFTEAMGLCISEGMHFYGMPTEQCIVVYVAAEAPETIRARQTAWKMHHGIRRTPNFYRVPDAVNLMDRAAVQTFISELRLTLPDVPGVVIFDTLACSMEGGDPNLEKDINTIYGSLRMVRDAFGATTLVVDHEGRDGSRGMAGNLKKLANADVVLHIEKAQGAENVINVSVDKIRDGERPSGPILTLRTEPVTWASEDGDITHQIVLMATSHITALPERKLPRRQRELLDALKRLNGRTTYGDWLRECKPISKSSFDNARRDLIDTGKVEQIGEEYVSLVQKQNCTSTELKTVPVQFGTAPL